MIGALSEVDIEKIAMLYQGIEAPMVKTTIPVAGLVKYADRPVKLLGRGKVEKTFQIEVAKASKTAIAAVEAAGGSVTVSS